MRQREPGMPKQGSPKPALRIGSRFSGFMDEEEVASVPAEVREMPVMAKLKRAWEGYCSDHSLGSLHDRYRSAQEIARGMSYSAVDVELFSMMLAEYQDERNISTKAGLFLSALMNEGKDDDYRIRTDHLGLHLDHLAYRNRKNLVVEGYCGKNFANEMETGHVIVHGDAGDWAAMRMSGGSITIDGDAGSFSGNWMEGGTLMIKGDAGDCCGSTMKGGSVTVDGNAGHMAGEDMHAGALIIKGNAGERLGENMKGGEIFVGGEIESIGEIKGGRISQDGELVAGM